MSLIYKVFRFHLLIGFCFLGILQAQDLPLRLQVLDQTGAGFPNVLVIVRSIEGRGEQFRSLSDKNGTVEAHTLAPGLYQVVATCPYGICATSVREFIVGNAPVELKLNLGVLPTQGNVVTIGRVERAEISVLNQEGKPVPSAKVLVRDANAEQERWYLTGAEGTVLIDLPQGEVTVVVIHNGNLVTNTESHADISGLRGALTIHVK